MKLVFMKEDGEGQVWPAAVYLNKFKNQNKDSSLIVISGINFNHNIEKRKFAQVNSVF